MIFICALIAATALYLACYVPSLTASLVEQFEHLYLWLCFGAGLMLCHSMQSKRMLVRSIEGVISSTELSRANIVQLKARRETVELCIAYHVQRICKLQDSQPNVELIDCQFGKAARENELASKNSLIAEYDGTLEEQQKRIAALQDSIDGKKEELDSLEWDEKLVQRLDKLGLPAPAYISPSGSPLPVYTSPPASPMMTVKAKSASFFRPRRFFRSRKVSA